MSIDIEHDIGKSFYAKCDKCLDISVSSRYGFIYDPLLESPFHKDSHGASNIIIACVRYFSSNVDCYV